MLIKQINGDILTAKVDVICQQVNCQGAMGSGLAKAIYLKYPEVKWQYHQKTREYGSPDLALGKCHLIRVSSGQVVANLYGQRNYGYDGSLFTSYEALTEALTALREKVPQGKIIGIPHGMSSCLAGGDWNTVVEIISKVFKSRIEDIIIVKKQ